MIARSEEYWKELVRKLLVRPESPCLEFKSSNSNPQTIGKSISALTNSAAINHQDEAYLLWGIEDSTKEIIGTKFNPDAAIKRNEPLQGYLERLLEPSPDFEFHDVEFGDGRRTVLMIVKCASHRPVAFEGVEYARVGSSTKPLKGLPELERRLWRSFDATPFENRIVAGEVDETRLPHLLDFGVYFRLMGKQTPMRNRIIIDAFANENLINQNPAGTWDITNLAALLFAKNWSDFPELAGKALRILHFQGRGKTDALRQFEENKGYAVCFEEALERIIALAPIEEQSLNGGRLETVSVFPEAALRELLANALIHQDFTDQEAGPMVNVFQDRIEITNPGESLNPVERLLDMRPKSRNKELARIMRSLGLCENAGSGIDKAIEEIESRMLPPPLFDSSFGSMKAALFAWRDISKMAVEDRIHACYLHACLRYSQGDYLTSSSLRNRFDVDRCSKTDISGFIREAVDAKRIRQFGDNAEEEEARFVPVWA